MKELDLGKERIPKLIKKFCKLDEQSATLVKMAVQKFNLSARAYDRLLKLARTIADMELSEMIELYHIAEAISYRDPKIKYLR